MGLLEGMLRLLFDGSCVSLLCLPCLELVSKTVRVVEIVSG